MNTTKVPARRATTGDDTRPRTKAAVCDAHTRYTAGCTACRRRAARYNKARQLSSWQPQVPALGTMRRLRGLAVQEWPARALAELTGLTMRQVQHIQQGAGVTVRVETRDAVARVANKIDHRRGPSPRSRTIALRHGWVPLAAWEDPDTDRRPTGVGKSPVDVFDDAIREHHATGASDPVIAARIGDGATTTKVRERRLALGLPATNRYGHPVRQDVAS